MQRASRLRLRVQTQNDHQQRKSADVSIHTNPLVGDLVRLRHSISNQIPDPFTGLRNRFTIFETLSLYCTSLFIFSHCGSEPNFFQSSDDLAMFTCHTM